MEDVALDIPRAKEIAEMMEFFEYSVKPTSTFNGTICFTFSIENSDRKLRYLVECKKQHGVRAQRIDMECPNIKYDCEVTSSIEDFLHVYSGKASPGEMAKMCYTGRVYISGLQFRLVTRFAQSFDFSSQKWTDFYAWQKRQQERGPHGSNMDEQPLLEQLPKQIALYIRGGVVNMSAVQRNCFEASFGRIFGSRLFVTYTALVHQGIQLRRNTDVAYHFKDKKFGRSIRSIAGHLPKRQVHKLGRPSLHTEVLTIWEDSYPLIQVESVVSGCSMDKSVISWSDSLLSSLQGNEVGSSMDESTTMESKTRRIDLRDAGMQQLSKIMDNVVGERQPVTKSNYLSAPARLMCEIRKWLNQANEQQSTSVPLHSVLRDIDTMIAAELGKPTRPAQLIQKELKTTEIIRYNTRRDLARMKQSIAGLKRNLLAHQMNPKSLPDSMNCLMLDY
ncbi:hypothetical protein AC1031_003722 [Aphanomyces cochlioides]|nr:hypothetical protein AC1031_003722 [Aphanomyces cochlioides]